MTDQTAERDQYARAIREAVRIRLGTNALRLAEEGRPVMLNMSEAEAAADAVLAVRDAARQAATPTGIRGLLEHVGIDTTGRDITIDGKVVDAAPRVTPCGPCGAPWSDGHGQPGDPCPAAGETTATEQPVVAYRDPNNPRVLLCRQHGQSWHAITPVTAEDLPDGGVCTFGRLSSNECGRDVLAGPSAVEQPAEAQPACAKPSGCDRVVPCGSPCGTDLLAEVAKQTSERKAQERAAVLREAADQIDAETAQLKAGGVLESDKFRPCRDASAQLRRMADEETR